MGNADKSLLLCLAAAAASGAVTMQEAAPHLKDLDDDPPRPYWPALRRALHRTVRAENPERPACDGQYVRWREHEIGSVLRLYKAALPQEQQARIAYETFLTRFFDYLWEKYCYVSLADNDAEVILFVPRPSSFTLDKVWAEFVEHAYSLPELRRSFLLVLNSVKLAPKNMSPPHLPPVTVDHAAALLGIYNASIRHLVKNPTGDHVKIAESSAAMDSVLKGLDEKVGRQVEAVTAGMSPIGCTQFGSKYVKQCIERAQRVVGDLRDGSFASIQPLISLDSAPSMLRSPGDNMSQVCYVCGSLIGKKDGINVSKFVVESPYQALQSSPSAKQPTACPNCAQISTLCPIKPTDRAVIVSLRKADDESYLYNDRLRQMVLGELNLLAGRYCQLTCTEWIKEKNGKKPLSQKLGQVQYAMLKVAELFPADSLHDHTVVVSIDGGEIAISRRHTVALSGLVKILKVSAQDLVRESGSPRLTRLSSVVHLLQADRYHEAIHEMIGAFRRGNDLSRVDRAHLDTLTDTIAKTWHDDLKRIANNGGQHVTTEPAQLQAERDLQLYRDVLALTGLLVPFIEEARRDLSRPVSNDRLGAVSEQEEKTVIRELKKLIEQVESFPQAFDYTAAQLCTPHKWNILSAQMYVNRDTRTISAMALSLLEEANLQVSPESATTQNSAAEAAGREPQSDIAYRLTIDILQGVFLHLNEKRYRTSKQRHDLAYQLKLSLYARFPRLIASQKDKENK